MFAAPKEEERRLLWQRANPRKDFVLKPSHYLCEKHFHEENIVRKITHKDQSDKIIAQEFVRLGFEKGSIDLLKKKYDSLKTMDSDKRATLDQVFRDLLLALLSSPQAEVSTWQQFVTYCILACRHDLCTPTMPVVLLGDIFDALTLDKCEQLFRFVEDNVAVWKEELFFSACKNNLLRMCNDLLRRLSRSQNTVFCGRILLFLAKFFPFSERSGLNIVSEFNLDNVTEYGGEGGRDLDVLGEKDDAMEEGTKPETKMKLDYNLYCKFWALQDFFRNPNQCYNKMEWKTFSSHSSSVLLAFKSFKLEHLQLKHSLPVAEAGKQHYFAKFLTSQKLLELQLSDANFRRYVLLQFLILFQYLHSPVKFKSESCELKVDQLDWVKETTGLVYSLMAETPPNGPQFVNTVRQILQREEQWNAWKNEGCPEFQRPAQQPGVDDTAGEEMGDRRRAMNRPRRSKRRLGDLVMEADSQNNVLMGNPELTKLWNLSVSNLDACKSKERDFLPSLESYFEEAMEQADPSAMVDDQYKKINDGNFGWRALRLLARRSPHFFTHSNNPINKLPDYLEMMIKRIMKDRPSAGGVSQASEDSVKAEPVLETEATGVGEAEEMELLKGDDKEEGAESSQLRSFSTQQLDCLATQLAPHWRKVAYKLGYQKDEVALLERERGTDEERARNMLQVWAGADEDASPDNLAYTLEGLGLPEAAATLKAASP